MQKTCIITANVSDTVWLFLMPLVKLLEEYKYNVVVIAGRGKHGSDLRNANLKLINLTYHFSLSPIKIYRLFKRTRKIFFCKKPFIVICNDASASIITRFAAVNLGINKIVYFCHGMPFAPHSNLFEKCIFYAVEYLAAYFTNVIITMNDYDYSIARRFCNKVYIINGVGVSLEQYGSGLMENSPAVREQLGISKNQIIVAYIGRLIPRKGIKYFMRASKELIDTGNGEITFLIAGDGPLKKNILTFIKKNKLANQLKYIGYCRKIPDLMRAIDILILPTFYMEGLPRVILEAMASKVPIIATNVRGCQDIIDNYIDGILIPTRSSNAIIKAIKILIEDKDLYERMRLTAYCKVSSYYTIDRLTDQFKKILKDL